MKIHFESVLLCAVLVLLVVAASSSEPEAVTVEVAESVTVEAELVDMPSIPDELANAEAVMFYPVNMDQDTQILIIRLCEEHHIESAVVMAMIHQESRFQADAIGDNGESFGLMQIQPKWHYQRMLDLDCTDLMNPIQNVTVGVDYLAELLDRGNGLEWALAAYNAGPTGASNGVGFGYAAEILANSEKLKGGVEIEGA